MSEGGGEHRRSPLVPPDARQTRPEAEQKADQALNRRKSRPVQAPGRANAGQAAQEEPEVAARRLDEHPLADILVAAHPHPP